MSYIENTRTGQIYCPVENKFFDATWEPIPEDTETLRELIADDPERFKYCVIRELWKTQL